ncbi:uncharacterized protein LOC124921666 [Impatiens glandulifera]|uniref:uncharacterized protein LOC124921666 n=1 Tax=Impatiens glandulifera TaxID=253017 RepID=UPI001FB06DF5|nr:uncharacterized protein LOC124921666 [Impatiens glandulifera]
MASPVPAKSQTLLSFSLPQWKLTKNHTNNHHRGRRATDSSLQQLPLSDSVHRQSPARIQSPLIDSVYRQSPIRDSASETESSLANQENRKKSVSNGRKNGSLESSPDHSKVDKQSFVLDVDKTVAKESRSKIYIRVRSNSNNKPDEVNEEGKTVLEEGELEETLPKTWNLRPRKPVRKQSNSPRANSSLGRTSSPDNHNNNKSQSPQMSSKRSNHQEITEKKYKKQKFSISLSRDEIEEDIFAMNGSKPVRRPKKRSKTVQRQLDSIFPGLWLTSITLDSYKVPEHPSKV